MGRETLLRARLRRAYRRALSHERVWRRELPTEVEFWRSWLATKGLEHPWVYEQRLDPDDPLREPLIAERLDAIASDPVRVLDVGAGPLTCLGRRPGDRRLEIPAVAPLAEAYDALLAEAGVEPPVRTQACRGEEITTRFAPKSFDIAYARNALDHSSDPRGVIEQMLALATHFVALRHYRNEAVVERYEELHQWNFDVEDGRLVLWSPRERHHLDQLADVWCAIEGGSDHAEYVVAVLRPR